MEENLTPAQQDAQAEPTDTKHTVGADALAQAGEGKTFGMPKREGPSRKDLQPNKTVYVGNLYYEVTADQVKRVFSRFGELDEVRVIYDNRGLSRG